MITLNHMEEFVWQNQDKYPLKELAAKFKLNINWVQRSIRKGNKIYGRTAKKKRIS